VRKSPIPERQINNIGKRAIPSQKVRAAPVNRRVASPGLPSPQSDDSREMPTEKLVHILVHTTVINHRAQLDSRPKGKAAKREENKTRL
jgi:hypothetical protein